MVATVHRDARVQVNFHEGGPKWLALEYACLETAG